MTLRDFIVKNDITIPIEREYLLGQFVGDIYKIEYGFRARKIKYRYMIINDYDPAFLDKCYQQILDFITPPPPPTDPPAPIEKPSRKRKPIKKPAFSARVNNSN